MQRGRTLKIVAGTLLLFLVFIGSPEVLVLMAEGAEALMIAMRK